MHIIKLSIVIIHAIIILIYTVFKVIIIRVLSEMLQKYNTYISRWLHNNINVTP